MHARDDDVNVLALVKGTERWVFFYADHCRADLLRTLGRYASDPAMEFNWYDAAMLSQKVKESYQQRQGGQNNVDTIGIGTEPRRVRTAPVVRRGDRGNRGLPGA